MSKTVPRHTPGRPRHPLTQSESERVRALKDAWQAIPGRALQQSRISTKAAAIAMGKSESWVSRALRGIEKLGWRDVGAIDDPAFWDEVINLMVEYHEAAFGAPEDADAEIGRRVRRLLRVVR
jgi:hypothetical protein